jgi:hypothetical protein
MELARSRWLLAGRPRARILYLAGVESVAFGTAILLAVSNGNGMAVWLPQTHSHVSSTPLVAAGIIWAAAGALLLALGWWERADRYLFAVTVFVHAAWALAWVRLWFDHRAAGDWEPALSFAVAALAFLIVSGWPDP